MERKRRLRKNEEFQRVFRYGQSVANRQLVVYVLPRSDGGTFRVGVSVSKKLGKAVVRNRVKRLIKEAVRAHADKIRPGVDVVFIARAPAIELDYHQMVRSVGHVLRRAGLITEEGCRPSS
ncbi:MAG: ribonuclease P protein component [Bacillota bacterium]|nr:ribonuclease P protein component [Bacillota bacterium]